MSEPLKPHAPPVQPPEQQRYADLLVWGTRVGLVVVLHHGATSYANVFGLR